MSAENKDFYEWLQCEGIESVLHSHCGLTPICVVAVVHHSKFFRKELYLVLTKTGSVGKLISSKSYNVSFTR